MTDPPYVDSVQYSDLSNFFRVWLKWLHPGKVDWNFSINGSAVAEDNLKGVKYGKALAAIWKECNRVLNKNGKETVPLTLEVPSNAFEHAPLAERIADAIAAAVLSGRTIAASPERARSAN